MRARALLAGILTPYFGRIAGGRDTPQNPSIIERESKKRTRTVIGTYRRGITMKRDNSNGIIFG